MPLIYYFTAFELSESQVLGRKRMIFDKKQQQQQENMTICKQVPRCHVYSKCGLNPDITNDEEPSD